MSRAAPFELALFETRNVFCVVISVRSKCVVLGRTAWPAI